MVWLYCSYENLLVVLGTQAAVVSIPPFLKSIARSSGATGYLPVYEWFFCFVNRSADVVVDALRITSRSALSTTPNPFMRSIAINYNVLSSFSMESGFRDVFFTLSAGDNPDPSVELRVNTQPLKLIELFINLGSGYGSLTVSFLNSLVITAHRNDQSLLLDSNKTGAPQGEEI
ncbi:hypothetical protein Tco_0972890 [Tanacetum coccineum]